MNWESSNTLFCSFVIIYTGFEIRRKSTSLTRARTRQNYSRRVFLYLRRSFARLSSANIIFIIICLLIIAIHLSFISTNKQKVLKKLFAKLLGKEFSVLSYPVFVLNAICFPE